MDLVKAATVFTQFLRPHTFPLAIRLVKQGEELPPKARRPLRDHNKRLAVCQVLGMARHNGWTMAVGREDQSCPIGSVVFGFAEALPFYTEGNLCEGMYTATKEAGAVSEASVSRLPLGEISCLLVAPLERATFIPDVVLLYVNGAQLMRLVHAALYHRGGKLTSSFSGRAECSEAIVQTVIEGTCQVVLPGNGERVFAHTQDHEMAFAIPGPLLEEVLSGLEATHKAGIRYPVPGSLDFEPVFPPKYRTLAEMWKTS